jgi:hypothetical protein
MIEEIKEVEKYVANPKQTPVQASANLLLKINSRFRFIELIGIGGEGILLKALDETGKQIVLKVARSQYQGKYAMTPNNKTIFNGFSFKGKPKSTNTCYERFLEGAILQRDLFQQVFDDQVTCFSVPQIYSISQDPLYLIMPFLEYIGVLRYFKDFKKHFKSYLIEFFQLSTSNSYI